MWARLTKHLNTPSLPIFGRWPVATFLPTVATSVGWSTGAATARGAARASPSASSGADPPVLSLHPGTLAGEASFIRRRLFTGHISIHQTAAAASTRVVVMMGDVGLPPSGVPVSELGEVAALGGGFPLLVGLVRVLVGEVWRLGSVVVVVLGMGWGSVALVVVVMVVCVVGLPAAVVVVVGAQSGAVVRGISCDGGDRRTSITVLNRIQGRRRRSAAADDADTAVDARGVLSLLQSAEAGRLVLLVLRAAMTASPWGSVEPAGRVAPVRRMWGRI